jgi:lysophospholipase L1-like esterase
LLTGVAPVQTSTSVLTRAEHPVTAQRIPIQKGYVAFGDSYAAGIGTGTTQGGGCRKGQNSYPKQLASEAGDQIDFQNLPCSGAKVGEVLQGGKNSQIDAWTNPQNSDIATISIGGNDIGFYDILTACVLRVGQFRAGDCNEQVQKAYDMINGRALFNDIASALHQIIDKSGRADFKIYQTGYPAFFNVDTDSCDFTTFYYWQPGHHSFHLIGNWAYLFKDLRLKLNNLVIDLNTMLSQVVDQVNQEYPEQRVVFIDPNPAFNGHRFCEKDGNTEVTEPDSSRIDTWLFLSGWPDNSLLDSATASGNEAQELRELQAGNTTALPDPYICNPTATGDNDWYDRMLCEMAQAVMLPPPADDQGPNEASLVVQQQMQAIADGNFTALEIPWYVPTRSAKTFHPKTRGQNAYKQLITDVW